MRLDSRVTVFVVQNLSMLETVLRNFIFQVKKIHFSQVILYSAYCAF